MYPCFSANASSSMYFFLASANSLFNLVVRSAAKRATCDRVRISDIGAVGSGRMGVVFGGARPNSERSTAGEDK